MLRHATGEATRAAFDGAWRGHYARTRSLADDLASPLAAMSERTGLAVSAAFTSVAEDAGRKLQARSAAIGQAFVALEDYQRRHLELMTAALTDSFRALSENLGATLHWQRMQYVADLIAGIPDREWIEAHWDDLVDEDADWDDVVGEALRALRAELRTEAPAVPLPRVDPIDLAHLVLVLGYALLAAKPDLPPDAKRLLYIAFALAHAITAWYERSRPR